MSFLATMTDLRFSDLPAVSNSCMHNMILDLLIICKPKRFDTAVLITVSSKGENSSKITGALLEFTHLLLPWHTAQMSLSLLFTSNLLAANVPQIKHLQIVVGSCEGSKIGF